MMLAEIRHYAHAALNMLDADTIDRHSLSGLDNEILRGTLKALSACLEKEGLMDNAMTEISRALADLRNGNQDEAIRILTALAA